VDFNVGLGVFLVVGRDIGSSLGISESAIL
jgi:hypothetical protein